MADAAMLASMFSAYGNQWQPTTRKLVPGSEGRSTASPILARCRVSFWPGRRPEVEPSIADLIYYTSAPLGKTQERLLGCWAVAYFFQKARRHTGSS